MAAPLVPDLGIPDGAARVLVLAESSHWDPAWQRSPKELYTRTVRGVLDQALDALRDDRTQIYSIESLYFLDPYWNERPERRPEIVEHMNSRRLRLTGGGITTPDTVLSDTEAILRDFLLGQTWLRDRGIAQEPELCCLPDNFGDSPCLPELLRAAGFRYAAFSRLDGMYARGAAGGYPVEGSSAARLLADHSLDFVWRVGNSEVLARWNAFVYDQGDLLGVRGPARWLSTLRGRSESSVADRIDTEVARLAPLARTRYLFCPIGRGFDPPIARLGQLVRRYNEQRFPATGTWVVLAGLDDYFRLVEPERSSLPVLDLDPNPLWMGFLSSRPSLKRRARRIVRTLVARDAEDVRTGTRTDRRTTWWRAVVMNHNAFISGTSPTRIVESEQEPWLLATENELELPDADLAASPPQSKAVAKRLSITAQCTEGIWVVDNGVIEIRIEQANGGLATVSDRHGNRAIIDLVSYADTGGPWRMGHEIEGGRFELVDRASAHLAAVSVNLQPHGWARIDTTVQLERNPVVRSLELHAGEDVVWVGVRGEAPRWRTILVEAGALPRGGLKMDVPGGRVRRAATRGSEPTFWRARGTVVPEGGTFQISADEGMAVARIGDAVAWVALRNAPFERTMGFVQLLARRAWGPNDGPDFSRVALRFGAPPNAEHVLGGFRASGGELLAVKYAEDGRGVIARLEIEASLAQLVPPWPVAEAWICDARERDQQVLAMTGDDLVFRAADGRIQTVRLVPR